MKQNKFYSLWLALICIIIFIIQYSFPQFTDMFVLNQQSYIQIWRFVSAIFLHGSIMHLAYNMFALILFGLILEKFIGSRKFLLVFLLTGILANLISVNFYESALGASGAVFGVIGALTIIRPGMTVWAFSMPMPLFLAAILWAAGDLMGIFMPSNIANLAHLSGLGLGLILGLYFRFKRKQVSPGVSYKIELPEQYVRNWEDRFIRQ